MDNERWGEGLYSVVWGVKLLSLADLHKRNRREKRKRKKKRGKKSLRKSSR